MKYFLINAFGKDRPGIVKDVSKVLYELGFNIEDSTMSRLGGEFTIMLVVEGSDSIDTNKIKDAFNSLEKKGITVNIKEIPDIEHEKKQIENIYKIIVYGGDKPGIVYNVSKMLADNNINIIDMNTEKAGDLYILITEVETPENFNEKTLYEEVEKLKDNLGVDINVEKIESIEM